MFGDKVMIGREYKIIEAKGRVILPKFSFACEGDELILYQDDGYISFFEKNYFLDLFKIREASEFDNPENYLKWKNYLDAIFLSIESVKVDAQRRVLLSRDIINQYELFGDVYMVGAFDHVNVYSSNYVRKKKL